MNDPANWLYLQFYFQPAASPLATAVLLRAAADRLLLDFVGPVCLAHQGANGQRYFFIRYHEEGFHVRVRLYCAGAQQRRGAEEALLDAFLAFLAQYPQFAPTSPGRAALYEQGVVRRAKYEPELDKYGGVDANSVAEQHFADSSDACLQVLALMDAGIARAHLALWLMGETLAGAGLNPQESVTVLQGYAQYWMKMFAGGADTSAPIFEANYAARSSSLDGFIGAGGQPAKFVQAYPQVQAALGHWRTTLAGRMDQLAEIESGGGMHGPFQAHLGRNAEQLKGMPTLSRLPFATLLILPNFIHMLNNRIGVDVLQEAQLAYLLARHLGQRHATGAAGFEIVLQPGEPSYA